MVDSGVYSLGTAPMLPSSGPSMGVWLVSTADSADQSAECRRDNVGDAADIDHETPEISSGNSESDQVDQTSADHP